jgi:hypothetical protein
MIKTSDLIRENRKKEIWMKHCGYLYLNMNEFMEIQKRLMLEQLTLLGKSIIGKEIMKGKTPSTIEEFRKVVPLTTYENYGPALQGVRTQTGINGSLTPSRCTIPWPMPQSVP